MPDQSDFTTLEEAVAYVNHRDEQIKHLRGEVEFWRKRSDLACTCGVSEPDEFGNRDLLEDADCPLHGGAS